MCQVLCSAKGLICRFLDTSHLHECVPILKMRKLMLLYVRYDITYSQAAERDLKFTFEFQVCSSSYQICNESPLCPTHDGTIPRLPPND